MKYTSPMLQWSRAVWGMALLFGSLPVASRVLFGAWGFPEAGQMSVLCLIAGTYLQIHGRRRFKRLRDDAAVLAEALRLAAEGDTRQATALLTRVIQVSPRLWQAYQYRGQIRLQDPDSWDAGLADLNEAIRLAPREPLADDARRTLHDLHLEEHRPR